jgi:hypothetical protein
MMPSISQEYFDELCVENYEVFEMSSEEEAVAETVNQLQSQGSATAHLSLTYPTSAKEIREKVRDFQAALRTLDAIDLDRLEEIQRALGTVRTALIDQENNIFPHLFLIEKGFSIYLGVFAKLDTCWEVIETLLLTIQDLVKSNTSLKFRTAFQTAVPLAMHTWTNLYEQELLRDLNDHRVGLLLSTVYASVLHCEANKKLWMKTRTETRSFPRLMLDTLTRTGEDANENGFTVCRILTALCTFDDFRTEDDAATPVIQSGHTHVQVLAEDNAVSSIHQFLLKFKENKSSAAAAISSLRALGIQDDIVQSMVAVGVLQTAARLLEEALQSDDSQQLVTALVGLFRNVAANDDIKTTLCTGKLQSVVADMIHAMQLYPKAALLQEHACGLTAAMALRKPKNAAALVGAGVHLQIVEAMQQNPAVVTLQRQAALALRNLVSRSPELRTVVLDSAAEDALRTIAATHLGCQDEVYAALRDLGLSVTLEGRQMFGERNPNFRPVYE